MTCPERFLDDILKKVVTTFISDQTKTSLRLKIRTSLLRLCDAIVSDHHYNVFAMPSCRIIITTSSRCLRVRWVKAVNIAAKFSILVACRGSGYASVGFSVCVSIFWDRSLSTYAKFSKKLTFLNP